MGMLHLRATGASQAAASYSETVLTCSSACRSVSGNNAQRRDVTSVLLHDLPQNELIRRTALPLPHARCPIPGGRQNAFSDTRLDLEGPHGTDVRRVAENLAGKLVIFLARHSAFWLINSVGGYDFAKLENKLILTSPTPFVIHCTSVPSYGRAQYTIKPTRCRTKSALKHAQCT